jgi:acyl carrier protein
MDNKDRINKVVCDLLGGTPDQIKIDHNLTDDLGADSLDSAELVMELENEFDTEVQDAVCEKWKTVGDIYDYFQNL